MFSITRPKHKFPGQHELTQESRTFTVISIEAV